MIKATCLQKCPLMNSYSPVWKKTVDSAPESQMNKRILPSKISGISLLLCLRARDYDPCACADFWAPILTTPPSALLSPLFSRVSFYCRARQALDVSFLQVKSRGPFRFPNSAAQPQQVELLHKPGREAEGQKEMFGERPRKVQEEQKFS